MTLNNTVSHLILPSPERVTAVNNFKAGEGRGHHYGDRFRRPGEMGSYRASRLKKASPKFLWSLQLKESFVTFLKVISAKMRNKIKCREPRRRGRN